jgi:hypothetical protein
MLGFAHLMPNCWPEVSLHPEGPATGQLDQGFPWFSSAIEQTLSWYPNPHAALHASHAALPMVIQKLTVFIRGTSHHKKILRGFSPQANYIERATAACRRS